MSQQAILYAEVLALLARVYRALDAGDGDALSACFASDPQWHRPDTVLDNHEAIRQMALGREPGRITAHLIANLVVSRSADEILAEYNLTVFVGEPGAKPRLAAVLAVSDVLTHTLDGLLVLAKRSKPVMLF